MIGQLIDCRVGIEQELVDDPLLGAAVEAMNDERWDEAVALFDAVHAEFHDSDERRLRILATVALNSQARALWQLERFDDAVAVTDSVAEAHRRLSAEGPPSVAEFEFEDLMLWEAAVRSIEIKALALAKLGRWEEALEAASEPLSTPTYDPSVVGVKRRVATALVDEGAVLADRGEFESALSAFDLLESYRGADRYLFAEGGLEVWEQLIRANVLKAEVLAAMGRPDEATTQYTRSCLLEVTPPFKSLDVNTESRLETLHELACDLANPPNAG